MADVKETTGTADGAGGATKKSKERTAGLGYRASRSLRRARAVYQGNEWQDSNEADFLMQEANVLALMDLADAVREQQEAR